MEASQPGGPLPGTLELLILETLARGVGEAHGYGIARAIEQASGGVLGIEEGSLYPALQRLLLEGWIDAKWGASSNNRRARFYRLTAAGRRHLARERQSLTRILGGTLRVLGTA